MFNLKCKTESGRYILGKIEHGQLSGSGVIGLEYFNPMAWESASGTSCPLLKICLRALSPPNLASAKTPQKSRAQFTSSNPEGDSVWIDAFPGLAKQRRGRGMPTCKWLAARANSFCEQVSRGMSNKAFLSSLLSIKKLPKECAVTSFGQQGELQKVGFNRLGCMVR